MRGRALIAAAATAGVVLGCALPAANGAGAPGSPRSEAETLRAENATIEDRRHSALLELYALESRLAAAEARVAGLRTRLAEVRAERSSAKRRLAIARTGARRAQHNLAVQVQALYRHGEPDAIAIVLGAGSVDEAITGLEGLQRSAAHTNRVLSQVRRAKRQTLALASTLARRAQELERLTAAAAETAGSLSAALADRRAYLRTLAAQRALNERQITSLEAEAAAAQRRSAQVASQRAPLDAPPAADLSPPPARALTTPGPSAGGRTLTVESTGYALRGTTASGLPTGWGIAAVDPTVIPLGTKMTVPGYGEAVAADTGSAVKGLIVDLWFPSTADALAWGRRTVTITLH